MATNVIIYYKSTDAQSVAAREVAYLKYNVTGATIKCVDTNGKNESQLLALITDEITGTYDDVCVACPTQATYSVAGNFTYDHWATCDYLLVTAKKGTVVRANSVQANADATKVKVDSGADGSNDTYKGMFMKFGTATIFRYITGYTASSKLCAVTDTGTAITTSETYTIFTHAHVHKIGDTVAATGYAARTAWRTLFPTVAIPQIISLLGYKGTDTTATPNIGFAAYGKQDTTATGATTTTLSDTGEFTLNAYTGGNYYVGVESATIGTGQIAKITSNTADALTLAGTWVAPTGTRVYQITFGNEFTLYNKYLPYAIRTYLSADTSAVHNTWKKLLDRYGDIEESGETSTYQDIATLHEYAAKGKTIWDAVIAGVVS